MRELSVCIEVEYVCKKCGDRKFMLSSPTFNDALMPVVVEAVERGGRCDVCARKRSLKNMVVSPYKGNSSVVTGLK